MVIHVPYWDSRDVVSDPKTFLEVAARHPCGVIRAMEIELTALKDA